MGRGQPFQKGGRHATSHNASNSSFIYGWFFRLNDGCSTGGFLARPSSAPALCSREARIAQTASLNPTRVSANGILRLTIYGGIDEHRGSQI
jgi:hypothetical protein